MKNYAAWMVVPVAIAAAFAVTPAAYGDTITTPLPDAAVNSSGYPTVSLTGTSGGSVSDAQCGHIAANANHVVRVTEDFTALRYRLTSGGSPTLLIKGPEGRNQCVMADSFSGGAIEVPGTWTTGAYSVFVGDQNDGSYSYTLTITQED